MASFHGEEHTNGAGAVLNALNKLADGMPAHRLVIALDADTHVAGGPRRHREEPHSQTDTALNSEKFGTVPRPVAQAAVAGRGVAAPLPPHRTPAGSPVAGALYRRHPRLRMPLTIWRAAPAHRPPSGGHFLGGGRCRGRACAHWLSVPRLVPAQVEGFAARYMAKGYTSCWGDVPPPDSFTTFNSRTFLQAELHQATPSPTYAAGRDDDQARLAWRASHGSRPHLGWGPSYS